MIVLQGRNFSDINPPLSLKDWPHVKLREWGIKVPHDDRGSTKPNATLGRIGKQTIQNHIGVTIFEMIRRSIQTDDTHEPMWPILDMSFTKPIGGCNIIRKKFTSPSDGKRRQHSRSTSNTTNVGRARSIRGNGRRPLTSKTHGFELGRHHFLDCACSGSF